jgi:hypothetical protein
MYASTVKALPRMRSLLLLTLIALLSVTVVAENAIADSTQFQPIYGFSWPTHSIPVLIETSQPDVAQAVLNAMNTWNLAQQWFITTYMGRADTPFVFYQTNSISDSMITVTFNQTQTVEDLGWTIAHEFHDQQGVFKKVFAGISIDLAWQNGEALSDLELQTLATHELGHALGLDHTTFSTLDLMYHIPKVMFPSTLNLYAVYLLSRSTSLSNLPQQPVTLPGNIPYLTVSPADLETVPSPIVQTATTSSPQLSQVINMITYGPWPYVGFLAILAGVVIALAIRGRNRTLSEVDLKETEIILRENPITESQPIHAEPSKKRCPHCGAEVPRENLICGKCGMPAMYRK